VDTGTRTAPRPVSRPGRRQSLRPEAPQSAGSEGFAAGSRYRRRQSPAAGLNRY
jgi:hypothetical protein